MARRGGWTPVILVAVGLLVYGGAVRAGFYYDDRQAVLDNPAIRSWALGWSWVAGDSAVSAKEDVRGYRPVTVASYALDYTLWGTKPAGYHATQLALYLGVVLLAAAIASSLIGTPLAAVVAGLLILCHPANVEAAVYLSARASVLAALFTLVAAYAWIRYLEAPRWSMPWYALVIAATVLALGSKESAILLVGLLWVIDDRGRAALPEWPARSTRERLLALTPVLLLTLAYGGLRWSLVRPSAGMGAAPSLGGAWSALVGAAGGQLGLVIAPFRLAIDHVLPIPFHIGWVAALLGLTALGVAIVMTWTRRPLIALALAWFLAALAPLVGLAWTTTLGLLQEHRGLLAVVGLAWLAASGVARGGARWRTATGVVFAVLVLVLGSLTVARVTVWGDEVRLWADAVRKSPTSPVSRLNLGAAYARRGEAGRAVAAYREALALAPGYRLAYANLGTLYYGRGEYAQAREALGAATRLDPDDVPSWVTLGLVDDALDEAVGADAAFARAVAVVNASPDRPAFRLALADGLAKSSRWRDAAAHYRQLLADGSTSAAALSARAHLGMGFTAEREGDVERAIAWYRQAVDLDPGSMDARYNLANLVLRSGRTAEAMARYEAIVADDPAFFTARFNLGRLYEQAGRLDDARAQYRAFLAAAPPAPMYVGARAHAATRLEDRGETRP